MALSTRSYARSYLSGGGIPPGVKGLLIANCVVFVLQLLAGGRMDALFGLIPSAVVTRFFLWQLATYMFLHGGILHLVFNMLWLWMFGRELEGTWGTDRFLKFYFTCGILAGVLCVIGNYAFGLPNVVTIGASGAIYGLLAASAALWPDRMIIYIIVPMKMKYFVGLMALISFVQSSNVNSGVSNVAHLGGLLFGYILVKMPRRRGGVNFTAMIQDAYKQWKLQRAKRKFQAYMRKQGRGPFVN
jgi:membrane associated rhomboid family serine protease